MMALMEDLLTLAKVGQVERSAEPFEVGEVVNEVVSGLAEIITQAEVSVNVGDLPTLRAPKTLLASDFQTVPFVSILFFANHLSPCGRAFKHLLEWYDLRGHRHPPNHFSVGGSRGFVDYHASE